MPVTLLAILLAFLMGGCSLNFGGTTTTEQRTHRYVDDGGNWRCVMSTEDIGRMNGQRTKQAVCYEKQ